MFLARGRAKRPAHAVRELAAREPEPQQPLGGSIGLLLALALSQSSLNDWGWRVPFAFGVLIAPVGIYIRSQLVETLEKPAQERMRAARPRFSPLSFDPTGAACCSALALISGGTITNIF